MGQSLLKKGFVEKGVPGKEKMRRRMCERRDEIHSACMHVRVNFLEPSGKLPTHFAEECNLLFSEGFPFYWVPGTTSRGWPSHNKIRLSHMRTFHKRL